jgi:hypothetical protein
LEKELDSKNRNLDNQKKNKNELLTRIDSDKILHVTNIKKLRLKSHQYKGKEDEFFRIQTIENMLTPAFLHASKTPSA